MQPATDGHVRRPIARRRLLAFAVPGTLLLVGLILKRAAAHGRYVFEAPGAAGAATPMVREDPPPAVDEPAAPVTLLLATDRQVSRSRDPITFILALDNPTDSDLTLTFNSSQVYDIVVSSGDSAYWTWAGDRGFGQVITERTYPPGVTLLGRETWDWRGLDGDPVPPGVYRAQPSLMVMPTMQVGNSIEFTLDVP